MRDIRANWFYPRPHRLTQRQQRTRRRQRLAGHRRERARRRHQKRGILSRRRAQAGKHRAPIGAPALVLRWQ